MRKLNVRFFLLLLTGVALFGGVLALVYYLQQDRIAAALLWQAQSSRQAEEWEKASLHYERYLEFKPDDAAVMIAYAEMLEQQLEKQQPWARNPRKVVYLLEEALRREADREDLRRRVVKHYLLPKMRRYKDAEAHLDILQRAHPEDGELWQERAVCQEQLGQYEPAAESLQKATRFPPEQIQSCELLAGLLRKRLNRAQQADDVIAEMVAQNNRSHDAYLARARYRMEFGLGDVSADAAEAIRLAPDNAEAILLQAVSLQHGRKIPEAIAQLEHGLKLYPNDPRMYKHLAWLEYMGKKPDVARQHLQAGIVNCPDAFELQTALAELLIQGKMFDQVNKIIAELKAKGVRDVYTAYLTARISVARDQWTEAVLQLEKLRPEARAHQSLLIQVNILLAECYRQLGDDERQMESLKHVLELDAQSLPARLGIAALLASTGRLNEAIKEYEQIVALPAAPVSAAADMIHLVIMRKSRNPAEKFGWPEIERLIRQEEQRFPGTLELLMTRADLLAAQQKIKEASALLASGRGRAKEARYWIQSAHYAELADRTGPQVLDEAVAALGDSPDLRLKRAAILVARSALAARRTLPDLERPGPNFTEEQTTQLLTGMAELYFTIQDYGNARRILQKLAAERSGDLHARLLLVEIALRENDREALPALLAEVRKIEPPGGMIVPMYETRFNLALAEAGDRQAIDRAKALLQTLSQQRPSWPLVHQCLGRLAECEERKDQAITHYRQAIELGDTELHTHHRLIRLLVEAKREKDAEEVLARARQHGAMPLEKQRSMLAGASPALKSMVVQQFVNETIDRGATDPDELVWLGKMMWDTGDRPRALAAFRAAIAAGGHVADHWLTLVQALDADGKSDEAKQALEDARKKLPPDLARRTIANCLEVLRRYDEALNEYAAALREQPGDPLLMRRYTRLLLAVGRTADAINVLDSVLKNPLMMSKDDLAWARRNLACLSASDRTPEQFAKAFKLLKQNEAEIGPNIEDMRARVILLTQQPANAGEAPPRRQAIELLEKMVQHAQSGREDRFVLAKLYDTEGDWAKTEKQYRALIAAEPRNPMPLAHFARRLLERGKLREASEEIRKLDDILPGSPIHANLRARFQFLSGDTAGLISDLTSYCADSREAEAMNRAFLAGSLLDEFVRSTTNPRPESRERLRDLALNFYERSIKAHPEAVVRICDLWSHVGQRERALRWLRDPRWKVPLNLRASAEIAALRSAHASEDECRAVEKWLREEAARNPEVALDLHLADLAELQHDFKSSEDFYRRVLAKEPNHVIAMNNLAWVLAHRGPSPEALTLVQKAISTIGPIPDLLETRAKAYVALSRTAEAVQDLEDAVADTPTAMRYYLLATAREKNGNPDGAREAFHRAQELGFDARDLHPVDVPDYERLKQSHLSYRR
jgi:tetratricopeptide (TPR) repeat protein